MVLNQECEQLYWDIIHSLNPDGAREFASLVPRYGPNGGITCALLYAMHDAVTGQGAGFIDA
jgi:hypothetical protein